MDVTRLRLIQDLEYAQSLLEDQIKDLQNSRNSQRVAVQQFLKTKIPSTFESLLTPDQQRLLRLYRRQPTQLTEQEINMIQTIANNLERWRSGGCYTMTPEIQKHLEQYGRLYKFTIPELPVQFCIDIGEPLISEDINVRLNIVNIPINGNVGEHYKYPLTNEQATDFFDKVRALGVNPERVAQMVNPQIKLINETLENLDFIRLQIAELP